MKHKRLTVVRKSGNILMDLLEKHIPAFIFLTMFISFMIQVISRYFFKPLTWPMELNLFCYIWIIILGALQAQREEEHTNFSLVYDKVKPSTQRIFRIIGELLIISSFAIALYPSYKYVMFMGFKKANTLPIRMDVVFFPYLIFLVVIIARFSYKLFIDVRSIIRGEESK